MGDGGSWRCCSRQLAQLVPLLRARSRDCRPAAGNWCTWAASTGAFHAGVANSHRHGPHGAGAEAAAHQLLGTAGSGWEADQAEQPDPANC